MLKTEERFWAKVDVRSDSECWEWQACSMLRGYGALTINYKTSYAHRVSWEIANGPIPDGTFILHSCDNRLCVNPAHLRPGTAKENTQDMFTRGRNWQSQVTHCPKGHAYDEANTYIPKSGGRVCRACKRERSSADYYKAKRQA